MKLSTYAGKTTMVMTCGTSVLSNVASLQLRDALRRMATYRQAGQATPEDRAAVEDLLAKVTNLLESDDLAVLKKASAELNGFYSAYGGNPAHWSETTLWLVATDTWFGQITAGLLATHLKRRGVMGPRVLQVTDLNPEDGDAFREGVSQVPARGVTAAVLPLG